MAPDAQLRVGNADAPPSVLLVEDDLDIQEVLGALLVEDGFRVSIRSTIAESTEVLMGGGVHLLMTDRRLSDGDGIELLRFVEDRHLSSVRIILLTAAHPAVIPQEAPLIQALDAQIVAKPFDIDHLVDLARTLTGWCGRD